MEFSVSVNGIFILNQLIEHVCVLPIGLTISKIEASGSCRQFHQGIHDNITQHKYLDKEISNAVRL